MNKLNDAVKRLDATIERLDMKHTFRDDASIKFDTSSYVNSHGSQPKGTGAWAFQVEGVGSKFYTPSMSFSDAKKWITKTINPSQSSSPVVIRVLP